MRIIRITIYVVFCSLFFSCNQSNTVSLNHYKLEQILEASYDQRDTLFHTNGAIKTIVLKDSIYRDPMHYRESNYEFHKEIQVLFTKNKYPISIEFNSIEVLHKLDPSSGKKRSSWNITIDSTRCFIVNKKKSIAAILIEE